MWPKEREREKKGEGGNPACLVRPPGLLLPCSLWHTDRGRSGVKWTRQPESRSLPGETTSPLAQAALPTFRRDFFCVTWRGAREWLLNVWLAQASRAGREWPRRVRAEPANADRAVLELAPLWQFLKSAEQKSNYSPVMPVEAQEEGTLHWLNYRGRCSKSQNSKVCLTCGPWRQM